MMDCSTTFMLFSFLFFCGQFHRSVVRGDYDIGVVRGFLLWIDPHPSGGDCVLIYSKSNPSHIKCNLQRNQCYNCWLYHVWLHIYSNRVINMLNSLDHIFPWHLLLGTAKLNKMSLWCHLFEVVLRRLHIVEPSVSPLCKTHITRWKGLVIPATTLFPPTNVGSKLASWV